MWTKGVMGRLIFDETDLINAVKTILDHELDLKKVRIKGNYGVIYVKRKPYRIHRLLGEYYFGNVEGFHIHHLNKNSFDNRKDNLIKLTPKEHTQKYHNDIHKFRSKDSIIKTQKIMTKKRIRHDVKKEQVVELRNQGYTISQVAKILNCGYNTVWRRTTKNPDDID